MHGKCNRMCEFDYCHERAEKLLNDFWVGIVEHK